MKSLIFFSLAIGKYLFDGGIQTNTGLKFPGAETVLVGVVDILPDNVDKDKISAKVNDGVLEIKLPKFTKEEESRAQRAIEIK